MDKLFPQVVKPQINLRASTFLWPSLGYFGIGFLGYAVAVGSHIDPYDAWFYAWVLAWPFAVAVVCAKWFLLFWGLVILAVSVFLAVDHVRTKLRYRRSRGAALDRLRRKVG